MTPGPLVSVLVPVYNGAAFLAHTLASVQAQTYQQFEVLVVDDGSRDDSYTIAQGFAEQDPRIKVWRQTNQGTQAARNTALGHARGEWIALLDQDDLWLPKKLESQLELLQETRRPDLVFTNYFDWDGTRDLGARYTRRKKFPEGNVGAHLARWCLFGASSVLVTRAGVEAVGGFDPQFHLSGDWDLWLRLAERGLWARGVWEPQMRYRLWAGNESKRTVDMAREVVGVLTAALARPQTATWRRRYEKSLARARANLELAQLRPVLAGQPELAPAAIWRAWRHCPGELKFLAMYLGVLCPAWLGGNWFAGLVNRKICRKW